VVVVVVLDSCLLVVVVGKLNSVFRIWEFVGKKYLIVDFVFILFLELFWYRGFAE
jgi:hypothetical protein